eukprot:6181385-Pleurochrysis_carterae.AAC.1
MSNSSHVQAALRLCTRRCYKCRNAKSTIRTLAPYDAQECVQLRDALRRGEVWRAAQLQPPT